MGPAPDNRSHAKRTTLKALVAICALSAMALVIAVSLSGLTGTPLGSPGGINSSARQETAASGNAADSSKSAGSTSPNARGRDTATAVPEGSTLVVRFIDVDQGDAALLSCEGEYLLIDGGPRSASSKMYSVLRTLGARSLAAVIASHPDADHVGGLSGALNYARCAAFYCSAAESDTLTFEKLVEQVREQGLDVTIPQPGDALSLGHARVTFLGPVEEFSSDNDNSLVCRVDFGKTAFLFTGDAEETAERALVDSGADLRADVLKVSHHGSASSTTDEFLAAVQPATAVISVGAENDYGHPTDKVLNRLENQGIELYRTDRDGNVVATSDGEAIEFETVDWIGE